MTPRTLFIFVFRVLGIISLKELCSAIPQLISTVFSLWKYSPTDGLFMVFISLLTVALFLWIPYMLIFKSTYIVDKFGLDQGFSETSLQLDINISSILRIALIVTGILILLSEIPELCRIIYRFSYMDTYSRMTGEPIDWSPAVFSGVKIILGLLIIGERKRILEFLLRSPESERKEEA